MVPSFGKSKAMTLGGKITMKADVINQFSLAFVYVQDQAIIPEFLISFAGYRIIRSDAKAYIKSGGRHKAIKHVFRIYDSI